MNRSTSPRSPRVGTPTKSTIAPSLGPDGRVSSVPRTRTTQEPTTPRSGASLLSRLTAHSIRSSSAPRPRGDLAQNLPVGDQPTEPQHPIAPTSSVASSIRRRLSSSKTNEQGPTSSVVQRAPSNTHTIYGQKQKPHPVPSFLSTPTTMEASTKPPTAPGHTRRSSQVMASISAPHRLDQLPSAQRDSGHSIAPTDDELERMVQAEIDVQEKKTTSRPRSKTGEMEASSGVRRWGSMNMDSSLNSPSSPSSTNSPSASSATNSNKKFMEDEVILNPPPHQQSDNLTPFSSKRPTHRRTPSTPVCTTNNSNNSNSNSNTPQPTRVHTLASSIHECTAATVALSRTLHSLDISSVSSGNNNNNNNARITETERILSEIIPRLHAAAEQLSKLWDKTQTSAPTTATTQQQYHHFRGSSSGPVSPREGGITRVGMAPVTAATTQKDLSQPESSASNNTGQSAPVFTESALRREQYEEALAYATLHQQALSRILGPDASKALANTAASNNNSSNNNNNNNNNTNNSNSNNNFNTASSLSILSSSSRFRPTASPTLPPQIHVHGPSSPALTASLATLMPSSLSTTTNNNNNNNNGGVATDYLSQAQLFISAPVLSWTGSDSAHLMHDDDDDNDGHNTANNNKSNITTKNNGNTNSLTKENSTNSNNSNKNTATTTTTNNNRAPSPLKLAIKSQEFASELVFSSDDDDGDAVDGDPLGATRANNGNHTTSHHQLKQQHNNSKHHHHQQQQHRVPHQDDDDSGDDGGKLGA